MIDKVQVLHKDYLLAIDHMFAAVDAGDTARATKIDGAEVDPRFDAMDRWLSRRPMRTTSSRFGISTNWLMCKKACWSRPRWYLQSAWD